MSRPNKTRQQLNNDIEILDQSESNRKVENRIAIAITVIWKYLIFMSLTPYMYNTFMPEHSIETSAPALLRLKL